MAQTYRNIEVIVCDNASKDNTKEIAEHYAVLDKRIKYFRNQEINIGSLQNYIDALNFSSGEFVQMLHPDDWIADDYVEQCVKIFNENPDIASVVPAIVDVEAKEGGGLLFKKLTKFKTGRYKAEYFVRHGYRSLMGFFSVFSMMRREDAIRGISFLKESADDARFEMSDELRRFQLEKGYGTDMTVYWKVLENYKYFYNTDKAVYIKLLHASNTSYGYDFSTAKDFFKKNYFYRKCYEISYSDFWKKHRLGMRVYIGREFIISLLNNFIRKRFRLDYLKTLSWSDFKIYFKDYSASEKILVILSIAPFFSVHILNYSKRRLKEILLKKNYLKESNRLKAKYSL